MTAAMSKDPEFSPESWSREMRSMRVMIMVDGFDGYVHQMMLTKDQFKDVSMGIQAVMEGDDGGRVNIPVSDRRILKTDRFLGFKSFYTEEEMGNDF
jgi:hypothetical protein